MRIPYFKHAFLPLFIYGGMLSVSAFLCGCSDVGLSAGCISETQWNTWGQPLWGDPISPISCDGWWSIIVTPGKIGILPVSGGDDLDFSLDVPVPPMGSCNTGCPANSICVATVSNANQRYWLQGYTGYLSSVQMDNSSDRGSVYYFEACLGNIYQPAPFSLTIRRNGASSEELFGEPNYAETCFNGRVDPPNQFALHAIKNPSTEDVDIGSVYNNASNYIREDRSHDSDNMTLKQRIEELKDDSSGAHYYIIDIYSTSRVPQHVRSVLDLPIIEMINFWGYDLLICDSIDWVSEENQGANGMTWGLTAGQFMAVSTQSPNMVRTSMHEIGHAVGLDHWGGNPALWNIMREEPEPGIPIEVDGAYPPDRPQSRAYEEGREEWWQ